VFVRVMGPLGNDSPYTTAVVTTAGFRALIWRQPASETACVRKVERDRKLWYSHRHATETTKLSSP